LLRGIYSSAAGMIMEMDKVAMHAGNIANAQTAGFKRRDLNSIPFKELMINIMSDRGDASEGEMIVSGKRVSSLKVPVGTGSGAGYMTVDDTQGSLKPTGNTLDIAIDGHGYFTIQRKDAAPGDAQGLYTTRNGRFLVDQDGSIITPEGDFLVGDNGKITLPDVQKTTDRSGKSLEERVVIKENGEVWENGTRISKLIIQTPTGQYENIPELKLVVPTLHKANETNNMPVEDNLNGATGREIKIKQGFLEGSNIQIVQEMVGLIHSSKNYESGHKLIMSEDKILDKAINELGRTG
jgi:flagellar basal-body rod protein FlgF